MDHVEARIDEARRSGASPGSPSPAPNRSTSPRNRRAKQHTSSSAPAGAPPTSNGSTNRRTEGSEAVLRGYCGGLREPAPTVLQEVAGMFAETPPCRRVRGFPARPVGHVPWQATDPPVDDGGPSHGGRADRHDIAQEAVPDAVKGGP